MSEQFNLDEVSLQCFTNKRVYKKYLEKKYPSDTNAVLTETRKKAVLKAEALVDLFTKLIHHSSEDKYNVLDSHYFPFIEACIDYLEKDERRELASCNKNESGLPIKNTDNV